MSKGPGCPPSCSVQGRNTYQTSLDFNLDDATDYAAPNAQSATFPTTRPDPEKTLTRLRTRLAPQVERPPIVFKLTSRVRAWGVLLAIGPGARGVICGDPKVLP